MARNIALVAFGVVLGVFGAAAVGIHAASDAGDGSAQGPSPTDDAPAVETTPEPSRGVWDDLARCESTERWHINSHNGYSGGLQFDAPTWQRHGGLQFAPAAYLATRGEQILVAQRTLAVQGPSAWPVCGPRVGLHR